MAMMGASVGILATSERPSLVLSTSFPEVPTVEPDPEVIDSQCEDFGVVKSHVSVEEDKMEKIIPLRDSATTCMVAELVVDTEYHEFHDAVHE